MRPFYVAFLALALLAACASHTQFNSSSAGIRAGMTADDLQKLMGPPQNRQFKGDHEAWQWCSTGYMEADSYVLVWLTKGVVTGMQTYTNTRTGPCESFFRTANWEEAPDSTVDVRIRR